MKHCAKIALVLVAAIVGLTAHARTVRDMFITDYGEVFTSLSQDTRLDMLDYYDVGQKMQSSNNFGGKVLLDTVSADYLRVRTSHSSCVEMIMATSKRDTVLYVVTTYQLPTADSRIAAYDEQWNELDIEKYIKLPRLADFVTLPKGSAERRDEVAKYAQFPTIEYSVNPADKSIVARPTVGGYMTVEAYSRLKPYLADSLLFTLKGVKYKQQK